MSKQTYETVQLIKETIQELYCRFQPFIGAIFYIITKMSLVNDPGDLIWEPDRLGSDRILSDSDENRKDPIEIYRISGNESTNRTLVSKSLQDPTIGKTKEIDYRHLSDPTKQTLWDLTSEILYYPKILLW